MAQVEKGLPHNHEGLTQTPGTHKTRTEHVTDQPSLTQEFQAK